MNIKYKAFLAGAVIGRAISRTLAYYNVKQHYKKEIVYYQEKADSLEKEKNKLESLAEEYLNEFIKKQ